MGSIYRLPSNEIRHRLDHPVVALGFFDGVHAGHQSILHMVRDKAKESGVNSAVLTLDQHPAMVVASHRAPKLITSFDERIELLLATGVDGVIAAKFDAEFACQTPEQFVREVLVKQLGVSHVIAGYNYYFGHRGAGDTEYMKAMGARLGFEVTVVGPVQQTGLVVSSTLIRQLLTEGEVSKAAALLTRPYRLTGPVVTGEARGRKLGFPTANIALDPQKVVPADGVYAAYVRILSQTQELNAAEVGAQHDPQMGHSYLGVLSVSDKPTFNGHGTTVEVHLLDFNGDLYGKTIAIDFVHRLRPIYRYTDINQLIGQVHADIQETRRLLS